MCFRCSGCKDSGESVKVHVTTLGAMTALALVHCPIPKMSQISSLVESKCPKELTCVQSEWGTVLSGQG